MTEAHRIIEWQCPDCKSIQISRSKERHKMDSCKCGNYDFDLELHYCRWGFAPGCSPDKVIIIRNDDDI